MPLDRSALDAGTDAVVDGGVITDSDDQWGPWVPTGPITVPSVSTAPDAPATATVPSVSTVPDAPAITTVPSVSTAPEAPAITTVPSVSTALDAPATSPAPLLVTMPSAGSSGSGGATNQVCCTTGRRKAFRLCQLVEVGIYVGPPDFGEGRMVPRPRARLRLLLEVHQILVGPSRSRLGTNFRQHRRAVYHRKNMQL